jgi:DNA-binding response OmpR family regulator
MDLVKRKVRRGDHSLELTAKEFALLEYFMRNPNKPLSRTSIAEHVWDVHFDSDSNVIDVYINMLRKKLGKADERKLIHTIVGVGYVLRED